mmetsp:Transcript_57003/g.134172  ORF Transcript_57003/g.134172 Transcript_57003/m.134172 type:complete len:288 (-) Transcript_57003:404-1267(-)
MSYGASATPVLVVDVVVRVLRLDRRRLGRFARQRRGRFHGERVGVPGESEGVAVELTAVARRELGGGAGAEVNDGRGSVLAHVQVDKLAKRREMRAQQRLKPKVWVDVSDLEGSGTVVEAECAPAPAPASAGGCPRSLLRRAQLLLKVGHLAQKVVDGGHGAGRCRGRRWFSRVLRCRLSLALALALCVGARVDLDLHFDVLVGHGLALALLVLALLPRRQGEVAVFLRWGTGKRLGLDLRGFHGGLLALGHEGVHLARRVLDLLEQRDAFLVVEVSFGKSCVKFLE